MKELDDLITHIERMLVAVETVNDLSEPSHMPVALPQVAFQQLKAKLHMYKLVDQKPFSDFARGENG